MPRTPESRISPKLILVGRSGMAPSIPPIRPRVKPLLLLRSQQVCERLLLRIEQGKGRKDRFVMLSPQLLE